VSKKQGRNPLDVLFESGGNEQRIPDAQGFVIEAGIYKFLQAILRREEKSEHFY
jgi:hypothetical protein